MGSEIKLEVGKRYVMRNGDVTGPLEISNNPTYPYQDRKTGRVWTVYGDYLGKPISSDLDIVSEYAFRSPLATVSECTEPKDLANNKLQPEPLRWVENCRPDKPGIWAQRGAAGEIVSVRAVYKISEEWHAATRCYLGPIPEILPPRNRVVQRLWLAPVADDTPNGGALYEGQWIAETTITPAHWIRTDKTREVEQ